MRITPRAKQATRARILAAARQLFARRGFQETSTRELAARAGIAAGTLFNYFPNKEALAVELLDEALQRGIERFRAERRSGATLEEELFAHIASGLRELEPYRSFVGEVVETALSPFSRSNLSAAGDALRVRHLEITEELLREHGSPEAPSVVSLHLYWTLYLGVLTFWAQDPSPGQQESLALLDRSMNLFARSCEGGSSPKER
jgi:AcrR family transcriptional regulator